MRQKLWNGWEVADKIGEGRFGDVYKAVKRSDGMLLACAIKYVSLPKTTSELDKLVKNGVINSRDDAINYYTKLVEDLKREISIMKKFDGNPYIINCLDYFQETKIDGSGFDFYIRMELAEDIVKYFNSRKTTVNDVVQMGIDVCSALEACSKEGIVHKDIKPSNIFVGSDGKYKLGDFGIADTLSNSDKSIIGTYNYMSPEVYNEKGVTTSSDLYSLGIVMYKILNNNKLPFVSSFVSEDTALKIRMSGKDLPTIRKVDKNLMSIINKACVYDTAKRYSSPTVMKNDLEGVLKLLGSGNAQLISDTGKSISNTFGNTLKSMASFGAMAANINNVRSDTKNVGGSATNVVANDVNKMNDGIVNTQNSNPEKTISIFDTKYSNILPNNPENNISNVASGANINNDSSNNLIGINNSSVNNSNVNNSNVNNSNDFNNNSLFDSKFALSKDIDFFKDKLEKLKENFMDNSTLKKFIIVGILIVLIIIFLIHGCINNRKCDKGYVNKNGFCVKGYYYCNEGYTLNKDNKCSKTLKSIEASYTYSCEKGYTLQEDMCLKSDTKEPKSGYQCAGLFNLKGNKCVREESTDALVTYTCPSGYLLYDNKCSKLTNQKATASYYCSSGYKLSGTKCTKTEYTNPTSSGGGYRCNSGENLNGDKCYINATVTEGWKYDYCSYYPSYYQSWCKTTTYNCPSGYTKSGTQCYRAASYSSGSSSCARGTLSGGKCVYTTTIPASVKYNCPSGYTVAANQCVKAASISPSPKYYCASGFTLRGNSCVATISVDAVEGYTCDDGYVLLGNQCVLSDKKDAEKKYSCSKVYTLNGDKCETYKIVKPKVHYDD